MMITRRNAILIGLGLPVFAAHEFWNDKKPSDWTPDELEQLLTRSPWAKEASVTYDAGPGGVGRPTVSGATSGRRRSGNRGGAANPVGSEIGSQKYKAIVRWESALPIREATHNQSGDDPLANYILTLTGDVPMLGAHRDEDDAERGQRSEMLKQYTKLERRNDPIYLAQATFPSASSTRFYFSRREPIDSDDKQVTFVTKLGPIEVKARFLLKDMLYQGKLAL